MRGDASGTLNAETAEKLSDCFPQRISERFEISEVMHAFNQNKIFRFRGNTILTVCLEFTFFLSQLLKRMFEKREKTPDAAS